jgi:hypothetical protein
MSNPAGDAYHWLRPDEGAQLIPPAELAAADLSLGAPRASAPPGTLVFAARDSLHGSPPHWIGTRVPLVSEHFLEILEQAGVDNFQTIPVLLTDPSGQSWTSHAVFNVIGAVDAADPEASNGGDLVLARAKSRGLSVFRLADDPEKLLVNDQVMRLLRQNVPAEGWGFTPIEVASS